VTRINVVPPEVLVDQHLLAEYRELPRVFALAKVRGDAPKAYTLGAGHVVFFYDKTAWLSERQAALIAECQARGFDVQHIAPPAPVPGLAGTWTPTAEALRLNLDRLRLRLSERPDFYTLRGRKVSLGYYDEVALRLLSLLQARDARRTCDVG
jgi:deoxyribonuclease (pyrimidine dimer)